MSVCLVSVWLLDVSFVQGPVLTKKDQDACVEPADKKGRRGRKPRARAEKQKQESEAKPSRKRKTAEPKQPSEDSAEANQTQAAAPKSKLKAKAKGKSKVKAAPILAVEQDTSDVKATEAEVKDAIEQDTSDVKATEAEVKDAIEQDTSNVKATEAEVKEVKVQPKPMEAKEKRTAKPKGKAKSKAGGGPGEQPTAPDIPEPAHPVPPVIPNADKRKRTPTCADEAAKRKKARETWNLPKFNIVLVNVYWSKNGIGLKLINGESKGKEVFRLILFVATEMLCTSIYNLHVYMCIYLQVRSSY